MEKVVRGVAVGVVGTVEYWELERVGRRSRQPH